MIHLRIREQTNSKYEREQRQETNALDRFLWESFSLEAQSSPYSRLFGGGPLLSGHIFIRNNHRQESFG